MEVLLWDCKSCQQIGFPADTHKFCSSCGSPQKSSKLYPVASKSSGLISDVFTDGEYSCTKCNTSLSGAHKFCSSCGFDLSEDNSEPKPNSFIDKFRYEHSKSQIKLTKKNKKKHIDVSLNEKQNPFIIKRKNRVGSKIVLALFLLSLGWIGFSYTQPNIQLAAKTRNAIEALIPSKTTSKKGWCDKIPKDAKVISTKMKKRRFCVDRKGKAKKGKKCSGKIKKKLSEYCFYS